MIEILYIDSFVYIFKDNPLFSSDENTILALFLAFLKGEKTLLSKNVKYLRYIRRHILIRYLFKNSRNAIFLLHFSIQCLATHS